MLQGPPGSIGTHVENHNFMLMMELGICSEMFMSLLGCVECNWNRLFLVVLPALQFLLKLRIKEMKPISLGEVRRLVKLAGKNGQAPNI